MWSESGLWRILLNNIRKSLYCLSLVQKSQKVGGSIPSISNVFDLTAVRKRSGVSSEGGSSSEDSCWTHIPLLARVSLRVPPSLQVSQQELKILKPSPGAPQRPAQTGPEPAEPCVLPRSSLSSVGPPPKLQLLFGAVFHQCSCSQWNMWNFCGPKTSTCCLS